MTRKTMGSSLLLLGLGVGALALLSCTGLTTSPGDDAKIDAEGDPWAHLDDETDDSDAPEEVQQPLTAERLRPTGSVQGDSTAGPHTVSFRMAKDAFSLESVGKEPPADTVLVVEPPVPGKVLVASRRQIKFTPEYGFAPGVEYVIRLEKVETVDGVVEAAGPRWQQRFTTPELAYLKTVPVTVDAPRGRLDLEFVFSGPVDVSTVAAKTSLSMDGLGRLTTSNWASVDGKPNRVRATVRDSRLASRRGTIRTVVADGFTGHAKVAASMKGNGGDDAWAFDPDRKTIDVKSIHLVEGTHRFSVEVICDDTASEGYKRWMWLDHVRESFRVSPRCMPTEDSARDLIEISPNVPFSVVPTRGGFRIVGDIQQGELQVDLRPGLATVDGGMLKVSKSESLTVDALKPTVGFTTSGRYLPRESWDKLPVQHRNIEELEVSVRHVPESNLLFWLTGDDERATARVSNLVAKQSFPVRGAADERATTWIDVKSLLPEAGNGVYEVSLSGGGANDAARMLLTDMNLVVKGGGVGAEDTLRVWALGMQSGDNLSGVRISAVRPSGKVLTTCTTTMSGCAITIPDDPVDDDVPVALIARNGDDLTYLKFGDLNVEIAENKVQGEPYTSDKPYRASLYTERGVFRPGETAHVAGIVRDKDHTAPPKGMPIDLELRDPRGKLIRTLSTIANEAGMFELDVPFADYATTGAYRVTAKAGKKQLGEVVFSIEEFVPERMEVEAQVAGEAFLDHEPIPVQTQARYLFGGSAADHRYELACRLVPTRFSPKNNSGFTYGEALVGQAARAIELGRVSGTLGEEGTGELACPSLDHGGFTGSAKVVADVAVFEAGSGRTTNATATAPVHPAEHYVGIQTGTEKIEGGEPFTVTGVVVDWDGNLVKGVDSVEVELVQLESEWGYFWDEERGTERWKRQLRSLPAGAETVSVENGRFSVTMTAPDDAERFRLVARTADTRTALEVDGDGRRWWWSDGENSKDVTPRPLKPSEVALTVPESIEVGAAASVQFVAPFKGRALVTLETDQILRTEWMDVDAGEHDWRFTLGEFADNVYVSVLVVKDPHLESAEAFLPDRAFGVESIEVRPTQYTGKVEIGVAEEVRSGEPLKIDVDLGQGTGKRFVTVAAVDEGILSLTNFETPDPFDDLFPTRALGVTTWETIGWAMHLQAPGPSSTTGGDGESAAPGRVQMVKPVSLWSGLVEVPESGKTTVEFDLPRYRGKLRVMAVSAGQEKVATAEADVLVRDPVVLQTTLPRFLTQGDEAEIPVFLTNMSGKDREVSLSLDASAIAQAATSLGEAAEPLTFEGASSTVLRIPDGESRTAVFRVRTDLAAGGIRLDVVAKSEDLVVTESLEVPVEADGPRERRSITVPLDSSLVDIDPQLSGWVAGSERTSVWVTNNPYGKAFGHLQYVVRYPYGCIEQTTSSTRPLLYVGNLLETSAPDLVADGKIEDMVAHGVDRLMNMQTPSGGFAYWMGGSEPTPWGTAYATHMLLDAQQAGFVVPQENLDDAIDYLDRIVLNEEDDGDPYHHGGVGGAAYMHFVLAKAGKGKTARMQELVNELGTPSDGAEREAAYLLKAGLYLAGDRRYDKDLRNPDTSPLTNERRNDWSFYSDLRRRGFQLAVYADLFGGDGDVPTNLGRVVAGGLERQRSRYYTTQEVAWGMTGLGKVMQQGSRDYEVSLVANGKPMKADTWGAGGKDDEITWSLWRASEMGDLDLKVDKKGSGKLYAILNSEGVREGAEYRYGGSGLQVKRQYLDLDGRTINLDNVKLGDVVYAKVTLTNTSNERVQNIALVDRFPAGWEIENPRLGRGGGADWIDHDAKWNTDNLNLRDDRLEVFGALERRQKVEVVYVLRAVTSGTFALPPVEAEAMYDPTVWTRAPGGVVTIRGEWEDYYL